MQEDKAQSEFLSGTSSQTRPPLRIPSFKKKIPNLLTISRIVLVPFFVVLLIDPTPRMSMLAAIIFVVASLTDWLDGYLARLFNAKTVVGTLLDPLADKILVMAALVMLAALDSEQRIPAWIVVVFLAREMVISGVRSLAALRGTVVPASFSAKHKTAWTMVALVFLLVGEPYRVLGMLIHFHAAGMVFLWIALVLSLYSAIEYMFHLRQVWVESGTIS